ncbi:MAG: hypothetical protein ABL983_00365 [Nitrospira sp.]
MKASAKEATETELLKLLDVLAENQSLFFSQQGELIRERLKTLISEQRSSFGWDATRRLVLLFKLVLSCPVLLSKPPGFEWVLEDFIDAFHHNLITTKSGARSKSYEGIYHFVDMNVFREAWETAWGQLHRGRPKKPIAPYGVARTVEKLMVEEGLSLSNAVEKVAQQEGPRKRIGRGSKDADVFVEKSTIYKNLREVGNRERSKIQTDEVYLPGVGLIKPKVTDLRTEKGKAVRQEILTKRSRGFPKKPKNKN